MFNLTGSEIVVILLLALVVLGPEKLPDAIRRVGRTYAELKKLGSGFQEEFKSAMDEPIREMRESADMLRKSVDFGADGVQDRPPSSGSGGDPSTVPAVTPAVQPAEDSPLSEPTHEIPFGEPADEPPATEPPATEPPVGEPELPVDEPEPLVDEHDRR